MSEPITSKPLIIFLSGLVAAFVAGVTAIVFLLQQIDSRTEAAVQKLHTEGKLPSGPRGEPGEPGRVRPIKTGTFTFDKNDPSWKLSEGNGNREFRRTIRFGESLKGPNVMIALTYFDASAPPNVRIRAQVENISEVGFDAVISTFSDTVIHGAGISWIAFGE